MQDAAPYFKFKTKRELEEEKKSTPAFGSGMWNFVFGPAPSMFKSPETSDGQPIQLDLRNAEPAGPGDYVYKERHLVDIDLFDTPYGGGVHRALIEHVVPEAEMDVSSFDANPEPVVVKATAYRLKIIDQLGPALEHRTRTETIVWFLLCEKEGKRRCGLFGTTIDESRNVVTPLETVRPLRVRNVYVIDRVS